MPKVPKFFSFCWIQDVLEFPTLPKASDFWFSVPGLARPETAWTGQGQRVAAACARTTTATNNIAANNNNDPKTTTKSNKEQLK